MRSSNWLNFTLFSTWFTHFDQLSCRCDDRWSIVMINSVIATYDYSVFGKRKIQCLYEVYVRVCVCSFSLLPVSSTFPLVYFFFNPFSQNKKHTKNLNFCINYVLLNHRSPCFNSVLYTNVFLTYILGELCNRRLLGKLQIFQTNPLWIVTRFTTPITL